MRNANYIDINTYNHYSLLVEKNFGSQSIATSATNIFGKPFMFSEYGPGGGEEVCDNGVDFIKTLVLSPFSGTAGAAMNWDWQYPGQEFLWHHMGPVNDLMSGIKLDEENWQAMPPIVSINKAVEILYLRNFEADNFKAVGAVSNRTYNYYTQATDSPCNNDDPLPQELSDNPIYQDTVAYAGHVSSQTLFIPNMGSADAYKINWYNALTGNFITTIETITTEPGLLPIYFPTITGDETRPILFFEIYRANESSFKLAEQGTTSNNDKVIVPSPQKDTSHSITPLTNWETVADSTGFDVVQLNSIALLPNPSNDYITVQCPDKCLGAEWQLRNTNGEILESGNVNSPNFSIDLSVYAGGLYYFYVVTNTETYVRKIIKQ